MLDSGRILCAKEQGYVMLTGQRLHIIVYSMGIMTQEGPGIDYGLGVFVKKKTPNRTGLFSATPHRWPPKIVRAPRRPIYRLFYKPSRLLRKGFHVGFVCRPVRVCVMAAGYRR